MPHVNVDKMTRLAADKTNVIKRCIFTILESKFMSCLILAANASAGAAK